MDSGSFLGEKNSPVVRRLKRFAEQNLGAGGIQFHRASAVKRVPKQAKDFLGEKNSPVVRRPKRFAEQNLGAGGIQFHRASEIEKGSQKGKRLFGKGKAGNPSSYLP